MRLVESNSFHAIRKLVCAALLLLLPAIARADFSGYYAPANWTITNSFGGAVDTSGAPASIQITGPDESSPGDIDFTITAPIAGTVEFDWLYTSIDLPVLDTAGYLLNGAYIVLAPADGLSGPALFPVAAGDVFGFRVSSDDGTEGPGVFTISNFSAPVPEASVWAMFGMGSALLIASLRLRRKL